MAKYSRLKVLTTMVESGLVPVFYHSDSKIVTEVVEACIAGGVRCFEFTNRGDLAHEVFKEVAAHYRSDDRIILGAGTIMEPATAALYIQLGANFIVGPALNPEVARLCNRRKVAYCPGCGTVSEISYAEELGVEICKVFPASALGGPAFIKDVLAPLPWARLMPTGGVEATEESVTSWFKAGVCCVGMGGRLFNPKAIEAGDYAAVTRTAKQVLAWIKKARGAKPPIA
ncbi:MAG: bifunctional 4-hydroxy-2-oxoglutarate aldolase/2-dehydro-3-deoxy-phosphogluconate aldolase [Dehalococcoidia bacterium]